MRKNRFSYRGIKYNPETGSANKKREPIKRILSYRGQKHDAVPGKDQVENLSIRKSYRGIVY